MGDRCVFEDALFSFLIFLLSSATFFFSVIFPSDSIKVEGPAFQDTNDSVFFDLHNLSRNLMTDTFTIVTDLSSGITLYSISLVRKSDNSEVEEWKNISVPNKHAQRRLSCTLNKRTSYRLFVETTMPAHIDKGNALQMIRGSFLSDYGRYKPIRDSLYLENIRKYIFMLLILSGSHCLIFTAYHKLYDQSITFKKS